MIARSPLDKRRSWVEVRCLISSHHHPPPRDGLKARATVVRHLQVNFVSVLQAPDPQRQPLRAIGPIAPNFPQALDAIRKIRAQDRHQPHPILKRGRGHDDPNEQPEGIHQDMAFAPFDLLPPLKADLGPLGRGLDALTIHTAG